MMSNVISQVGWCSIRVHDYMTRAVASLTVPSGQEFHFPHFFLKFRLIFLIFPQTLLIFFLILALRHPPGEALATPLTMTAVAIGVGINKLFHKRRPNIIRLDMLDL